MKRETVCRAFNIFFALIILLLMGRIESLEKKTEERELTDWSILQMAIILTESKFDSSAVNKSGARGLYQQMPIYVDECNRILDMRKSKQERYSYKDAHDVDKSIEMFELLQSYYNPEKDIDKAIKHHNNAGWYRRKIYENMNHIREVERIRKKVAQ